ncbi:MAG: sensor histidine kinase, partial [Bdellovibrionales bacterium]|nr:sensor histidine kinase [Bdellovibrionales bacterium]
MNNKEINKEQPAPSTHSTERHSSMCNAASVRLKRLNGKIMETWEDRVKNEIDFSSHQSSRTLRNSLPEFLDHIANALSTTTDRSKARVILDKKESHRLGKQHGKDRTTTHEYNIDQLIFEYHILRQVICDALEEEAILSPIEREVIVCAIEQGVNDASTEFSESNRDVQEQFSQTLAHDIRGPLTSAKLNAQIFLKKFKAEDQGVKNVKCIIGSIDRIDLMLNDLLDAGQLIAGGQLKLEFVDCDLDVILGQIYDETNILNENRINWKSIGPVVGHWNENGLRRVIDNLVINALKFSTPNTLITLSLKKSEKDVEVAVHNFGNPISAEEKPILFDRYRKARTAEGKKGWGLGLTVVKGITEAHGGHVEVESSPKAGTTFTVYL